MKTFTLLTLFFFYSFCTQAQTQTVTLNHWEPDGNGFIYDNLVIDFTFSLGEYKEYYRVNSTLKYTLSYKYNGKIYESSDVHLPNNSKENQKRDEYFQNHLIFYKIIFSNGYIATQDGDKFNGGGQCGTKAVDNLKVIRIEGDNSKQNTNAHIESWIKESLNPKSSATNNTQTEGNANSYNSNNSSSGSALNTEENSNSYNSENSKIDEANQALITKEEQKRREMVAEQQSSIEKEQKRILEVEKYTLEAGAQLANSNYFGAANSYAMASNESGFWTSYSLGVGQKVIGVISDIKKQNIAKHRKSLQKYSGYVSSNYKAFKKNLKEGNWEEFFKKVETLHYQEEQVLSEVEWLSKKDNSNWGTIANEIYTNRSQRKESTWEVLNNNEFTPEMVKYRYFLHAGLINFKIAEDIFSNFYSFSRTDQKKLYNCIYNGSSSISLKDDRLSKIILGGFELATYRRTDFTSYPNTEIIVDDLNILDNFFSKHYRWLSSYGGSNRPYLWIVKKSQILYEFSKADVNWRKYLSINENYIKLSIKSDYNKTNSKEQNDILYYHLKGLEANYKKNYSLANDYYMKLLGEMENFDLKNSNMFMFYGFEKLKGQLAYDIGTNFKEANNVSMADKYMTLGLDKYPNYKGFYDFGLFLLDRNEVDAALPQFLTAIKYKRKEPQTYMIVSKIYLSKMDYVQAYNYTIKAKEKGFDKSEIKRQLEKIELKSGKYISELNKLSEAIPKEPTQGIVIRNRTIQLYKNQIEGEGNEEGIVSYKKMNKATLIKSLGTDGQNYTHALYMQSPGVDLSKPWPEMNPQLLTDIHIGGNRSETVYYVPYNEKGEIHGFCYGISKKKLTVIIHFKNNMYLSVISHPHKKNPIEVYHFDELSGFFKYRETYNTHTIIPETCFFEINNLDYINKILSSFGSKKVKLHNSKKVCLGILVNIWEYHGKLKSSNTFYNIKGEAHKDI